MFFLIQHTVELQQLDDDIETHVAVETVINFGTLAAKRKTRNGSTTSGTAIPAAMEVTG